MQVDLFYLSPNPYGGWVTFTSHLMKSLRHAGVLPHLFKVRERSETTLRPFGYSESYRNIDMREALARPYPKLIVAAAKNFRDETVNLWDHGARLVVHDPTELKNLPKTVTTSTNTVVIRKAGLEHLPNATFIRHPYVRVQNPEQIERTQNAISVSRVDFDKRTDILLDANRLLPKDKRISIRGFENRIYTRFKIVPSYPEWEQSIGHFPRGEEEAFKLLQRHTYHVDMSEIKGDGGGTQYTFLEAWDAGCINVINGKWLRPDDDMVHGVNCWAVPSARVLADLINPKEWESVDGYLSRLRSVGYAQLALHHPKTIGEQYKAFLKEYR